MWSRYCGAFRLHPRGVTAVVSRSFLILLVFIILFVYPDTQYSSTSSFFLRTTFFGEAATLRTSPTSSSWANGRAQENFSYLLSSRDSTLESTLPGSLEKGKRNGGTDLTEMMKNNRSVIVKPRRMPSKKEYEDEEMGYLSGSKGLNYLKGRKNSFGSSLSEKEEEGGSTKFSTWEMLFSEYSGALSTLRCGTTDAYCPFNAPICCGDRGSFFCIPGGFQCCRSGSSMKGDSYCSQSETCCVVGQRSVCCGQGTQCSSTMIPLRRNATSNMANGPSENDEDGEGKEEGQRSGPGSEEEGNENDSENDDAEDGEEEWIEVPQCIPTLPECSFHVTQDACLAANDMENSSSSLQCGWCCKEQRCITVNVSVTENRSSMEVNGRRLKYTSLGKTTFSGSSGSDSSDTRNTDLGLPRLFDNESEDSTPKNISYENASCTGGYSPLTSLHQRCPSNCNYYSTCALCTSAKSFSATKRAFSTIGYMISSVSDYLFSKKSDKSVALASTSSIDARKNDMLHMEDSCLWCLSTEQCISRKAYATCQNSQFILHENLCELSWYDPPMSHRWSNLFFSAILKVMILVFLFSVVPMWYRNYKQRQLEEAGLRGMPRPQQLLPQYAVRRYGFSYVNPAGNCPSRLQSENSFVETQPACANCGIKISIDPGSDDDKSSARKADPSFIPETPSPMLQALSFSSPVASTQPHLLLSSPAESLTVSTETKSQQASSPEGNTIKGDKEEVSLEMPLALTVPSSPTGNPINEGEERETEKKPNVEDEECVSHFITLLPCGHILCAYCVEEYVQDFYFAPIVQKLRRWWRWLQRRVKWLQPRNRSLAWGRPRTSRTSRVETSFVNNENNAKGGTLPITAAASDRVEGPSSPTDTTQGRPTKTKGEDAVKSSVKKNQKLARRSISHEKAEKVPLLSADEGTSTEEDPDQSEDAEDTRRREGPATREGASEDGEREKITRSALTSAEGSSPTSLSPSPASSFPLSSPHEGTHATEGRKDERTIAIATEGKIPSLEELMETFQKRCPYCFCNVEDIFFADRLRRI